MFDYFYTIIICYFFCAFVVLWYVPDEIKHLPRIKKYVIYSFVYTLFFGIGIASTGGEPGLGFPAPIILAYLFSNPSEYIYVLYAFLFWWVLILFFMMVRRFFKSMKNRENER